MQLDRRAPIVLVWETICIPNYWLPQLKSLSCYKSGSIRKDTWSLRLSFCPFSAPYYLTRDRFHDLGVQRQLAKKGVRLVVSLSLCSKDSSWINARRTCASLVLSGTLTVRSFINVLCATLMENNRAEMAARDGRGGSFALL